MLLPWAAGPREGGRAGTAPLELPVTDLGPRPSGPGNTQSPLPGLAQLPQGRASGLSAGAGEGTSFGLGSVSPEATAVKATALWAPGLVSPHGSQKG